MNTPALATLIFPAGMPRAQEYLRQCQAEEKSVIGASSLRSDPARALYPAWAYLPMITDPRFAEAFRELVDQQGIGSVLTPNIVVWDYLNKNLPQLAPNVRLLNESPLEEALGTYRRAGMHAKGRQANMLELASPAPAKNRLSKTLLAAVYRHADQIPGMCDNDKIQALCEVSRFIPDGDMVEIGTWWGKSAFVLATLSRLHQLGPLLCVDPWKDEHLIQADADAMINQASKQASADEAHEIYLMNLAPFGGDLVNYIRAPSVEAARIYRHDPVVHSATYGTTRFCGRIALLHIDGNHSLEAVEADVAAWTDLVVPGGWIIFDDYIWPYGDGPKIAGDAFLEQHKSRVATSFVMGSALFVQLA